MPHILQSSAKKLKVQNTELFKTKDYMEKLFHSMNILDFPATIQLGNMWRRQSTAEMFQRKGNFKRSGVKTRCSVRISLSTIRPPNLVVILSRPFCRSRFVCLAVLGLSLFVFDVLLCHGEIP